MLYESYSMIVRLLSSKFFITSVLSQSIALTIVWVLKHFPNTIKKRSSMKSLHLNEFVRFVFLRFLMGWINFDCSSIFYIEDAYRHVSTQCVLHIYVPFIYHIYCIKSVFSRALLMSHMKV